MADEQESSQGWSFDRWLAVVGTVIGILGLLASTWYVQEARQGIQKDVKAHWLAAVELTLLLSFTCGIVLAIWRTRDLKNKEKELQQEKSKSSTLEDQNKQLSSDLGAAKEELKFLTQKDARRWESRTNIVYGHIQYPPFLEYDATKGDTPTGLGVEFLGRLLDFSLDGHKVEISPEEKKRDWGDILEGLIKNKYDVVATPLFATFERSRQVAFTAPLFFSNIGLFVSKEASTYPDWQDMTAGNMKSIIERIGRLRFMSVKGEISEKLANKYSPPNSIEPLEGRTVLRNLFERVAASKSQQYALFCESFYAHYQPKVKSGEVVNVLGWHQILYPVCFAVRLSDYQLVNLLNIRLLQFTQMGGALPLLAKQLSSYQKDTLTVEEVKKHFVAEWPNSVKKDPGGQVHA